MPSSDNRLSQGSDDLVQTTSIKKALSATDLLGPDFPNPVIIQSSGAKHPQLTLPATNQQYNSSNNRSRNISLIREKSHSSFGITTKSSASSYNMSPSPPASPTTATTPTNPTSLPPPSNSKTPRYQTASRSTASGASTSRWTNSTGSTAVASGSGSGPSSPVQSRTGGSRGGIRSGGSGGSGSGLDPPPSMRQMGNSSSPHGSNGSSTRYTGGPTPANTRSRRAKKCQPGQHTYKYQYGARGLVCSIVFFPIGLLCLYTDRYQRCSTCGHSPKAH